jgi:hypothetical protein
MLALTDLVLTLLTDVVVVVAVVVVVVVVVVMEEAGPRSVVVQRMASGHKNGPRRLQVKHKD